MGWIEARSVRLFLPTSTDEFIGSQSAEGLKPFGEVAAADEVVDVRPQPADCRSRSAERLLL